MTDQLSRTAPAPFTADDYAARRQRAARAGEEAGLAGLLVTPGPDLIYFTGYAPVAITERITMLVIPTDGEPAMIVPKLERPDAENAPGVPSLRLVDWTDGSDPYEATAKLLAATGRYAVSDSAWAMHLLGLQGRLPRSSYVSMTSDLPMLRAIKDAAEIERLAAAGAAADQAYEEIVKVRFAGRSETEVAADLADLLRQFGHSQVDFTVVGSGPNGANPHHEIGDRVIEDGDMVVLDFGGLKHGYGSDTTRTVHVGEPTAGGTGGARHRPARPAGGFRGRQPRYRVPGGRPGPASRHHRSRLRRVLHPPDRTRHRPHHPRAAVHGGGRDAVVQPGMCFSIEPGIYLPSRFGVRIEDIVTVTGEGGRRLNQTPHEMRVVS